MTMTTMGLNMNDSNVTHFKPSKRRIIGLCGKKGSGKDSAAKFLINKHGFKRIAFADALRQTAATAMNIDVEIFNDPKRKETPIPGWPNFTYRRYLETLGTEYYRANFPGIWANNVKTTLLQNPAQDYVITDLRFTDEATMLRDMIRLGSNTVSVWEVMNPRTPVPDDWAYGPYHESEYQYKRIEGRSVLLNDGDFGWLEQQVEAKMKGLVL